MDSLEQQLADLQMIQNEFNNTGKVKKVPPAVPPKKKAEPQVPRSALVNSLRKPSYSSRIPAVVINNNRQAYYGTNTGHSTNTKDYVNVQSVPISNAPTHIMHVPKTIPSHRNVGDELPPPPPPPPPQIYSSNHKYDTLQNVDDYLPAPPSPVSSNYSELVRATSNINYNQERPHYPPIYQNEYPLYDASQTSTYESLYEPINPRPQSNNSSEMNKINTPNVKTTPTAKSPTMKPSSSQNEAEVDALTNLLVKSISHSQDADVFGICRRCNGKVIGDNSGCTAMGFVYHVECFCCYNCNGNLQGKPFYAVEGHPYCEVDYYETLEKCSVCYKPILDRILRATGKPYHPSCFTCVVCGKSLDGIPFTVDAMNQIHCIEDFHKKFAPRCCVCELPIMPEDEEEETVRVVALDRNFHVRCYRCEDCGLQLSSESEGRGCYPLDDHILCKDCNAHRIRQLTNVMTTDL